MGRFPSIYFLKFGEEAAMLIIILSIFIGLSFIATVIILTAIMLSSRITQDMQEGFEHSITDVYDEENIPANDPKKSKKPGQVPSSKAVSPSKPHISNI